MKKRNLISLFVLVLVLVIVLCACSSDKLYRSVKIHSYKGTCNIYRDKKELDLQKEMKIKNNDELRVKEESQVILKLDSDKFVCVKENTNVKFVASGKENKTKTRLHVLDGGVIVEVKQKLNDKESFEIASSNSVMAIRGTQISFDVEKSDDTITTTFSILTGQTETFLYKDDTMNSTLVSKEQMMSYTTSLIKTTDEIYKIYDSLEKVEIPTDELETKYNTKIEDITVEKSNEIIDALNEFERDNEQIPNIKKKANMTIDSSITYGENVLEHISDNNHSLNLYYSSSNDGEYSLYDSNKPLDAGVYYVKLENDEYVSDIKQITITKKMMTFTIVEEAEYGTNLVSKISDVDFAYSLYVSDSLNGTYTLYNVNGFLSVGSHYVKVESKNYTTEPTLIDITATNIDLPINYEQVTVERMPMLKISIDDNMFLKCPYASEKENGIYKYNIVGSILNDNNMLLETFTLDYGTREVLVNFYAAVQHISYEFNLPEEVFSVLNEETFDFELQDFITAYNLSIDKTGLIQADVRYYSNERDVDVMALVKLDDGEFNPQQVSNTNDLITFRVNNIESYDSITVYYSIGTVDTETFTFDLDYLYDTDAYTFNLNSDNTIITSSESNKLNIYYDLGFVDNSNYDLNYRLAFTNYYIADEGTIHYTGDVNYVYGNTRYAVIEGVSNYSYYDFAIKELLVYYADENGLQYILSSDDFDYDEEVRVLYNTAKIVSAEEIGSYIFDVTVDISRAYFEGEPSITLVNGNYNVQIADQVFDNFTNNKQTITIDNQDWQLVMHYDYNECMQLSSSFLNDLLNTTTYTDQVVVNSSELFNQIKSAFKSKYGIEISGDYYISYTNVEFQAMGQV